MNGIHIYIYIYEYMIMIEDAPELGSPEHLF